MPAKKAQARSKASTQNSDSSGVWKWVYVVGLVVAGLAAAFGFQNQILIWVLLLVGILAAIFFLDSSDVVNFGIRYLLLTAVGVTGALSSVPFVGTYLTNFVSGVAVFLGPVALTLLAVYFWKRYFSNEM